MEVQEKVLWMFSSKVVKIFNRNLREKEEESLST